MERGHFHIQPSQFPHLETWIEYRDQDGIRGGLFVYPGDLETLRDEIDAHLLDRAKQLAEAAS